MTEKRVTLLCLSHASAWYYFLPPSWQTRTYRAEADDRSETLTPIPDQPSWYAGTFQADRIARVEPSHPAVVRWELTDPAAESARFPRILTGEEWDARMRRGDEDDPWPERALYRAVTEDRPNTVTYLDGPWIRADGEPPPADGRTWVAELPYELSRHRELLHLFPGRLTGFREALAARLKRIPGVRDVFTHSGFEVVVSVSYDPPRQSWRGNPLASGSRSRKRGREVEEQLTRRQTFSPPLEIPGATRAEAAAAWDEATAKFVTVVTDMASIRPCEACNGTGIGPLGRRP